MKKRTLALLCGLTALLILGGGALWLFRNPAGVLQPHGPEEAMQSLLDTSSAADWRGRIAPVWDKPVTEFEDQENVYTRSFEAADRELQGKLTAAMGSEEAAVSYIEDLFTQEGWRELQAVQNGNYTFLPKHLFHFKPNANWAEAYAVLADILYPELNLHGETEETT